MPVGYLIRTLFSPFSSPIPFFSHPHRVGCTGSLRYMAVEVAACQPYSELVDIYSFGIIAYEMYVGHAPFGGMNRDAFMQKVVYGGQRPDLVKDDYGRKVNPDPDIASLLAACWDANPANR